jgi:hypothetical protein
MPASGHGAGLAEKSIFLIFWPVPLVFAKRRDMKGFPGPKVFGMELEG